KLTIILVTVLCVLLGVLLYFVMPKTYESVATVFPLRQSVYAQYIDLASTTALQPMMEGEVERGGPVKSAFPYTREDLFSDYASYLRNPAHLLAGAEETGIVSGGGTEAEHNAGKLSFVRSIAF